MTRLRLHRTAATSGAENVARSNSISLDQAERVPLAEGIMGRYGLCPANLLIENPNAVKTHSKRQIRKIARAMKLSGPLSPIVIDESYIILAGHARLAAAKEQGAEAVVPVVLVEGLTEAQKRLYLLGDNRLGDDGGLDRKKLAKQLPELQALFAEANFELIDSGFEVCRIRRVRPRYGRRAQRRRGEARPRIVRRALLPQRFRSAATWQSQAFRRRCKGFCCARLRSCRESLLMAPSWTRPTMSPRARLGGEAEIVIRSSHLPSAKWTGRSTCHS